MFMAMAVMGKAKLSNLTSTLHFCKQNSPLHKQFFVRIPQNTRKYILDTYLWNPGAVLRARKPLYGSAEAPRIWYEHVSRYLIEECKLQPTLKDPCLFISGKNLMILIHVDDVLGSAKCEGELVEFKQQLKLILS